MSEMVDIEFYKRLINKSAGYALHRIVLDEEGSPVDYIFIDINETFEEYTGLKGEEILNKKITEVLPGILNNEFDWIDFYGNIALNGGEEKLEQFSEPLNRYYHIKVFSPGKDHFVTLFTDETDQMRLSKFSRYLMEDKEEIIDYKRITDEMLEISEAKYVIFNLIEKGSKDFTTVSVSGIREHITKARKLLGFDIIGKKWSHNSNKDELTRDKIVTCFDTLQEIIGDIIPPKTVSIMKKIFGLGQIAVVKIIDEDTVLGDFTLIMPKGKKLGRFGLLELFASQVGLFLAKKEAEHYLKISHNRMKLAMDASENGFWDWNIDTDEVYISNGFRKMIGYEEDDLEFNIDALTDLMHPDDRKTVFPIIMEYIDKAQPYEEEFRFRCKDGSWKWISGRGKSYDMDDNGRPNRIVGMNVDISKIKEANEKLELSERNYRRLFETMKDMIFVSNLEGRIIYSNSAAVEALGYTGDEFMGMSCREVHYVNNEMEVDDFFCDIVEGRMTSCPLPLVARDGLKIPVETRVWKGEWNGEECLFWISKNLSAEQEILQKYDSIFRSNPALMAVSSIPGNVLSEVNDAFVKATGYSRNEVVGRTVEELNLFMNKSSNYEVNRLLEEGKIKNEDVKIRTRDGNLLDCIFYGEVIESQGKKFFLTMMIDITELKKTRDLIEHMSNHDELTGLYNRRFYETEVKRLDVQRNLPLSVIMIDVNGLKLINDAFGHEKGDEMLIKVANAMNSECRSDEIIARLGGDEFIVLLPKTCLSDAERLAGRLSESVSKESVGLIKISISCGAGTKTGEENFSETVKRADEVMYRNKLFESQEMRKGTIREIMKTLYEINEIEKKHSMNVAMAGKRLAEACGLNEEKANEVFEIGLKHDIGKIAIEIDILDKTGELTDSDWSELKRHSEAGYQILRSVNEYALMANYVLSHHERWDGTGYPGGLKGNDIPFESRIIAIADAYDAMTSDRPYRKPLNLKAVADEFTKGAGTQFDPELVKVFLEKVMNQ